MFTYEVVIAAMLLSSPGDDVPEGIEPWITAIHPAMIALAIEAEILDPRAASGYFASDWSWSQDLLALRGQYAALRSAPTLADCHQLPPLGLCSCMLTANREFREELKRRAACDMVHREEIIAAIDDTDAMYHVWAAAAYAQTRHYDVTMRRQSLHTVRRMIGPEAFYTGLLPPPLPLWAIPRR